MTELISTFHIEWFQFFAQLVNFSIALAILWFMVGRPLSRKLDERKKIIEEGVENGIKSETILEQSKQEADAAREQARKDALAVIADASHKAEKYTADAEHRAIIIEEKLVADAHKRAGSAFTSELHAHKIELAEKIVSASKDILMSELSSKKKQEEFIVKQLG